MALPYGVMIEGLERPEVMTIKHLAIISAMSVEPYNPYLRPMSSMTEEEKMEYITLTNYNKDDSGKPYRELTIDSINWLLENHFDFMGLIPKGLAIEVTKDDNPYE